MIADKFVRELVGDIVNDSLSEYEVSGVFETFGGECTHEEIDRLTKLAKPQMPRYWVGGGKTLDTAKAVAHFAKLPGDHSPRLSHQLDAPTSALSVIYNELGAFGQLPVLSAEPERGGDGYQYHCSARRHVCWLPEWVMLWPLTLRRVHAVQPEKPLWPAAVPHWRHWH